MAAPDTGLLLGEAGLWPGVAAEGLSEARKGLEGRDTFFSHLFSAPRDVYDWFTKPLNVKELLATSFVLICMCSEEN